MDYFKILTIIFMITMCYKIFLMDTTISENFDATPTLVDDWNAINQLAQISRQLMTGTLTVPGVLSVTNILKATGGLEVANKWGLYDTSDNWLRLNDIGNNTSTMKGTTGIAMQNLLVNTTATIFTMNATDTLSVASGGGAILNVDAGGVHVRRGIDGPKNSQGINTWSIGAEGNATLTGINGKSFVSGTGVIDSSGGLKIGTLPTRGIYRLYLYIGDINFHTIATVGWDGYNSFITNDRVDSRASFKLDDSSHGIIGWGYSNDYHGEIARWSYQQLV
jgi:hypothetical protein